MEILGVLIKLLVILLRVLLIAIPLLVSIAYMTLVERKVIASIQRRKGPNVVGLFGLLQPFADALKLLSKESVIPSLSNKLIFILAPIITLLLSLMGWAVFPLEYGFVISDISIGILYIFAVSSLGVYGVITSGWSSNSRYAFLGALRSAAQMVSYEVSIGLIVVCVLLFSNSLNMTIIVYSQECVWNLVFMNVIFILFFISSLAETNRPPFDLPEAEAELVAGYFVEYSSMVFALFFIGEYGSIMLMSGLCSLLFLGGWVGVLFLGVFIFGLKIVFIYFLFVWVRSAFPRYRYDQLMRLGWKVILPLSIGWVVFISGFVLLGV